MPKVKHKRSFTCSTFPNNWEGTFSHFLWYHSPHFDQTIIKFSLSPSVTCSKYGFQQVHIYRAAPNNSLISFVFFLLKRAKKTPFSSNIQTGDFSLNLVPKAFSLDLWNAIAKTPQLPWRWADLVLMRSCFLLHRRSWHIWWALFLVGPLAKES